jgi:hypothetical protein
VAPRDRGDNLYLTQALDQAAEPHIRALRYGLNVENLRNWKDGRSPLDSTARSYLTAIANDPHGIPLPYTPLTPPRD